MSSFLFGKHFDPLVTGDAREEELTVLVREVGESVLNQNAVTVRRKLLLSDIEETRAGNARVHAGAGDFHGAYYIRGGVGCQASNAKNHDSKDRRKADRAEEVTDDRNRRGVFHAPIITRWAEMSRGRGKKTFGRKCLS